MAQRAVVTSFDSISGTSNQNEMQILFTVFFLEETISTPRYSRLSVVTQWTDTMAQIKTKIQNAVIADGVANGYTSIAAADIIMPTYQKG